MSYLYRRLLSVHSVAFLGLMACLASKAPGQENVRPNMVLEAGEYKLDDLIDRAARYLKRNYLYDLEGSPVTSSGFKLQESLSLNPHNCEAFLSQIAYSKGFILVPTNPSLQVYEFVYVMGTGRGRSQHTARVACRSTIMATQEVKQNAHIYFRVTTKVDLTHITATDAREVIQSLFRSSQTSPEGIACTLVNRSSIMLSGMAPHVARAIRLLEIADTPRANQRGPATKPPARKKGAEAAPKKANPR